MTFSVLDGLRELAEKATPGPWRHVTKDDIVAVAYVWDHTEQKLDIHIRSEDDPNADAAFIAAVSPEVVQALCDVADQAVKRAEALHRPEPWQNCSNPFCAALARLSAATTATPKGADPR